MCGLCGFDSHSAGLLLSVDQEVLSDDDRREPVAPVDDRLDVCKYPLSSSAMSRRQDQPSRRSLYGVIGQALAVLWACHICGHRTAQGL